MECDTGSNESGHKGTKMAAKLTQKNVNTFDKQTAVRLEEVHLLQLAEQEMLGNNLWEHGCHTKTSSNLDEISCNQRLTGSKLQIYFDSKTNQFLATELSKKKMKTSFKLRKN